MAGKVKTLLNIQSEKCMELDLPPLEGFSAWTYFSYKAAIFLVVGPEIYRKDDYFQYPLPEWDSAIIKTGCEQIIYNCAGLASPQTCFEGLSESNIIMLFKMLHYTQKGDIEYKGNDIAEIHFCHIMNETPHSVYFKIQSAENKPITAVC